MSGAEGIKWPVLVVIQDELPMIGVPGLELDGQPFPFPTVGEWQLTFGEYDIATVTVQIPVRVRVEERETS